MSIRVLEITCLEIDQWMMHSFISCSTENLSAEKNNGASKVGKGKLLNHAGQLTLVTLLSSMPVYHLTIFPLAVWARKQIDKIRRSFLWKGEENANGCHCLVNWPTINRPKDMGGLGVLDLDKFGRALRVRDGCDRSGVLITNLGPA